MDGVVNAIAVGMLAPQATRAVLAVFIERVELNMKLLQAFGECLIVARDAMQGFQAGVGGGRAAAHHFDNGVTSGDFAVFLAAAGGTCAANFAVDEQSCTDDR